MRSLSKIIRFNQCASAVVDYHCQELSIGTSQKEGKNTLSLPMDDEKSGKGCTSDEIMEDAFQKAKQMMDSAREFSDRQMRETRETAARESKEEKERGYTGGFAKGSEEGRKEGREAGYREGLEQGRLKAEAESRKSLDELSLMIESVEKSKTNILEKFADDLENLAIVMAKSILKRELQTDSKTMRSIIISAMEEYRKQEWIRIYTSNKTASVLLQADNNIAEALKDISDNVKVIPSSEMEDSDCVIETPDQIINAGVKSQLQNIRHGIDETVKANRGSCKA